MAVTTARKSKPAAQVARAWEELYIAEGSDWFWWFGDSHSSAQDGLFDRLFRKHLQNVYLILGEQPPTELARPISQGQRHPQLHSEPTGLLSVKVDGRRTYFEWINAGHYVCGGSRGTMSMVTQGYISDLYFGFDTERLLLRLDSRGGPVPRTIGRRARRCGSCSSSPKVSRWWSCSPARRSPKCSCGVTAGWWPARRPKRRPINSSSWPCPSAVWPARPTSRCISIVELLKDKQSVERVPHEGAIETFVPSPDYELIMWQA